MQSEWEDANIIERFVMRLGQKDSRYSVTNKRALYFLFVIVSGYFAIAFFYYLF